MRLRAKPSDQLHVLNRVGHYSRPWLQLLRAIRKEPMRIWLAAKTKTEPTTIKSQIMNNVLHSSASDTYLSRPNSTACPINGDLFNGHWWKQDLASSSEQEQTNEENVKEPVHNDYIFFESFNTL